MAEATSIKHGSKPMHQATCAAVRPMLISAGGLEGKGKSHVLQISSNGHLGKMCLTTQLY